MLQLLHTGTATITCSGAPNVSAVAQELATNICSAAALHVLQLLHRNFPQTSDAFDAAACPCPPPLQDRGVDFPVRPQEAGADAGAPYYTPPAMLPAAVAAAQGLSPEDRAAIAGTCSCCGIATRMLGFTTHVLGQHQGLWCTAACAVPAHKPLLSSLALALPAACLPASCACLDLLLVLLLFLRHWPSRRLALPCLACCSRSCCR